VISRLVKIQLAVFVVVAVVVVSYGASTLFSFGHVIHPPYVVEAQFAQPGGIHERADVDLLGDPVGSVKELRPGPGSGTTVVLAIDNGVDIPSDVKAVIASKSAIGEAFVELVPQQAGGSRLKQGDVIPITRTTSPPDMAGLLGDLNSLAESVPTEDLSVALDELSSAVDGVGPSLGRLIDDSNAVSQESLDHVQTLTALIKDARTVLDTQVALGPQTTAYLGQLASLTTTLRQLDPTFDAVFVDGVRAGTEITNLLRDNQAALPVLLNNLVTLTDVAADRLPSVRKTLVVFPWALEDAANVVRYCDVYTKSGQPVQKTCHYDKDGKPIYSAHLALVLDQVPPNQYHPCTKGYEGTVKYQPDGTPVLGGAHQHRDSPPNLKAHCAASPADPTSPNVRGSQNVGRRSSSAGRPGLAIYNPNSGVLVTPDGAFRLQGQDGPPPPDGEDGLAWLLSQPLNAR
jgi:phospholipid/cholesterol/gamma-HCH transport system substrate-binding protein